MAFVKRKRDYEAEVDACIAHLTSHSQQYYEQVRKQQTEADGVLWVVFVVAPPPQGEAAHVAVEVTVKRSSFLPLTTVLQTKAETIIQIYRQCDRSRQFVAWFTIENPAGEPLVSKVMTIDAAGAADSRPASNSRPGEPSPDPIVAQSHAGSTNALQDKAESEEDLMRQLKRDMWEFQKLRDQREATPRQAARKTSDAAPGMSPGVSTAALEERARYLSQLGGAKNDDAQTASVAAQPTPSHQPPTRSGSRRTGAVQANSELTQQYQQLLRISLQVADSVARMGAAIDALTARVTACERDNAERPKAPPPDLVAMLANRIEALEKNNEQLQGRLSAYERVQGTMFTQVEQLRVRTREASRGSSYGAMDAPMPPQNADVLRAAATLPRPFRSRQQ